MRVGSPRIFVMLFAAAAVAACVFGFTSCGPSDLAKAYPPYSAAVSPRLEAETSFWEQFAERAKDQEDADGVARYRQFLEEKAKPYYVRLEADLAAVVPGHERLGTAHEQILGFARSRKEFVELELRRLDLGKNASELVAVKNAEDAVDAAYREYQESIADDVPDHRLSTLNALKDDFMGGKYRQAVEGSGDAADAVEALRKVVLPRLRDLRDGRFDDTPQAKLFRRCIVATEELFLLLADQLPVLVATVRSATRSEAVLRQADAQRTNFQQQIGAVQRDR